MATSSRTVAPLIAESRMIGKPITMISVDWDVDADASLEAMEAENMIPPEHLEKYKKEPALLEEDTRKALYFRFVSLAVVGGYL